MITILPAEGDRLASFRRKYGEEAELLVMQERGVEYGTAGIRIRRSVLEILSFDVSASEEIERRFFADSLLRAAASLAANRGAYRLSCALEPWKDFLKGEGFCEKEGQFVLPTENIVKVCKD